MTFISGLNFSAFQICLHTFQIGSMELDFSSTIHPLVSTLPVKFGRHSSTDILLNLIQMNFIPQFSRIAFPYPSREDSLDWVSNKPSLWY